MTIPKRNNKNNHDVSAEVSFNIDTEEIEVEYKGVKKKKPFFIRPFMRKQRGRERKEEKH